VSACVSSAARPLLVADVFFPPSGFFRILIIRVKPGFGRSVCGLTELAHLVEEFRLWVASLDAIPPIGCCFARAKFFSLAGANGEMRRRAPQQWHGPQYDHRWRASTVWMPRMCCPSASRMPGYWMLPSWILVRGKSAESLDPPCVIRAAGSHAGNRMRRSNLGWRHWFIPMLPSVHARRVTGAGMVPGVAGSTPASAAT